MTADSVGLTGEITHVLIYNAIWFGLSVSAVFLFLIRPSAAKDAFGRLNTWAHRHEQPILIFVFATLGVYLVTHGINLIAK
ncbi:MAG: hypothetical protein ACR2OC_00135 [Solirubrobacterales bacterium]